MPCPPDRKRFMLTFYLGAPFRHILRCFIRGELFKKEDVSKTPVAIPLKPKSGLEWATLGLGFEILSTEGSKRKRDFHSGGQAGERAAWAPIRLFAREQRANRYTTPT